MIFKVMNLIFEGEGFAVVLVLLPTSSSTTCSLSLSLSLLAASMLHRCLGFSTKTDQGIDRSSLSRRLILGITRVPVSAPSLRRYASVTADTLATRSRVSSLRGRSSLRVSSVRSSTCVRSLESPWRRATLQVSCNEFKAV